MQNQLYFMFVMIGGIAIIPFFARRFRVPSAALEIMFGALLFNTMVSAQPEWFQLLKEIGIIYLMFTVGMEVDLREILNSRKLFWYVLIPLLSLVIMPFIFIRMGYPFFLGIVTAMMSAGIVLPVLKETELARTEQGKDIMSIALTGELLSIILLVGIEIQYHHGLTLRAGLEAGKLLLLITGAFLALRVLYVIAWWLPEKVEKVMESEDPVEEGIRIVIFVAFAGALLAYTSGIEPILGSFMAGLIFSYVFKSKGRFEDKINAVGFGFFIPFFFIGVGAELDLSIITSAESLYLPLFLTFMVAAGNIFPLFFCRLMKITAMEALGMSFILSAPLSLMIVGGSIGFKMQLISKVMLNSLILTATLSSILYPALFRFIVRRGVKVDEAEERTTIPA